MARRILVCGGRDYRDAKLMFDQLDDLTKDLRGPLTIIHGDARGADTVADIWARYRGHKPKPFPADWRTYKNDAGKIRNQQMLDEGTPDLVICFHGGWGTLDMRTRAMSAGVKVIDIDKNGRRNVVEPD